MAQVPREGITHIDDARTRLLRHDAVTPPDESKVWIVGVVPFLPSGQIVAVAVDRGIEVPSGHVEAYDRSPASAVRREAWEEARIKLGELVPIACFRIITEDSAESEKYVALYATTVRKMHRFRRTAEARQRVVLTPAELFADYRQDEVTLLRWLVAEAQKKLRVPQEERA